MQPPWPCEDGEHKGRYVTPIKNHMHPPVKLAGNWHGFFRAKWHALGLGPATSSNSVGGSVSASRL
jgi:hypothetical protein